MDHSNDKLSIKNLLFTKAVPNHVINIPINGHKVFACTDCGDKFLFESSYNDHINRKSAKISYMCRLCNMMRVFYNRCNLLYHIRSHHFKTATINVTDLKVEPLPAFSLPKVTSNVQKASTSSQQPTAEAQRKQLCPSLFCYECKKDIMVTGVAYKDRASHLMQYTNEVYSCPVCLFALPSVCGLKLHLRLHLKCPPYYCPECGIHLTHKNVQYPYNHDCEGFKMMRATARLNCSVPDCSLFHPNDFKAHMRQFHLKKVYKCPFCVVACLNETTMDRHLKGHKTEAKALLFYQCDVCPGRYVLQNPKLNDHHLKSHINTTVYPCWACGSAFKEVASLLTHFIKKHNKSIGTENALNAILNDNTAKPKDKRIYRVVKRCDQCSRSFTYKCRYDDIQVLPNECPNKCTSTMESNVTTDKSQNNTSNVITCHLCSVKLSQDWSEIKKHYGEVHKTHKCLDPKIVVSRVDIKKYFSENKIPSTRPNLKTIKKITKKRKIRPLNPSSKISISSNASISSSEYEDLYVCKICGNHYDQKGAWEEHMISHRDPCMAYQCMECGQSFVVKPSFSKHLLLEHDIADVEAYVNTKQCYNENALNTNINPTVILDENLAENQCRVCREEFDCPEDLEKHFRVHGMAFLMKNTSSKSS